MAEPAPQPPLETRAAMNAPLVPFIEGMKISLCTNMSDLEIMLTTKQVKQLTIQKVPPFTIGSTQLNVQTKQNLTLSVLNLYMILC